MTKDCYLEQQELELSLLKSVLSKYFADILDIKQGYLLLHSIIQVAQNDFQITDFKLNEYYKKIVRIIEESYSEIEYEINDVYEKNNAQDLPSFYIEPHIFQDHPYIPFESLYDKKTESWNEINHQLNKSLDRISSAYIKIIGKTKVTQTNNNKFLKTVESYLNEYIKPLKCNQLTLDLKKEILKYKDQSISINITTRAIKFLQLLLNNPGKTISHKQIADKLELSFYDDPEIKNSDAGAETRFLKRELRCLVKKIGMSDKDFKQMVKSKRSVGYRLECN